jgi:hypothetical protein
MPDPRATFGESGPQGEIGPPGISCISSLLSADLTRML